MLVTQVCLAQPLRGPMGALLQPGFVRDLLCWVGPQTPGWSWEACEDPDPARCGAGARPGRAEVQCACAPFPGAVPGRRSRAPFPAPAPKARWQPWCHSHCHSPPVAFLPPSCWDSVPHLRSNERRAVRTEGRDRAPLPTVRRPLPLSVAEHIHAQLARNILIRY